MSATVGASDRSVALAAGFALTLAAGFFGWLLMTPAASLADPAKSLPAYGIALAVAAIPAAVAVVAAGERHRPLLLRAACAACLVFFGVLEIAGFASAPWIALALAVAAVFVLRPAPRPLTALVMLPLVGTLAGLYFAFSAERWLAGAARFVAMLRLL